ncbi:MAG: HAMP domain-containing sensor histidine kinase [Acidimicrobiia bacterium]|nr:HAMP domain-containing sensor histidine kinase [Acidimicrobiia bacterium]
MPRRGFRPEWGQGDWRPPPAEWWNQEGNSASWQTFGRRVARRFILGFFFFLAMLIGLGAFIATAIIGSTGVNRWVVILIAPLVALALVALVVRYYRRTLRPVREVIGAAGSLAGGDYSVRVANEGSATMRSVTRSFNEMAERLEGADEARRRLLADLGHEMRTPLTVVQGEIEAMLDGVHTPDAEHLELLLEEVAVMERLLEDLRTLTLAESGSLSLHLEPLDVADLVQDVLEAHRRTIAAAQIAVTTELAPDLGEVVLDPVRMREILANLVVNAIRAMPEGGTLTASAAVDEESVHLRIADTGTGISEEDLPFVFERFRRGSTSSGSGLGLTITRDLVEAHGGSIGINSTVGAGTTVTVALPLVRPPE